MLAEKVPKRYLKIANRGIFALFSLVVKSEQRM